MLVFPANYLFEFVVTCILTIFTVVTYIFYRFYVFFKPKRIKNLPYVEDNSILGAISSMGSGKFHEISLARAKEYNTIYQRRIFGHTLVLINDKNLIRIAMKDITGKGDPFHQIFRRKYINNQPIKNIFELGTNDEWKMRRNKFRHAFSAAGLKNFEVEIQILIEKLVNKIEKSIVDHNKKEIVKIDILFGQLTMDVICKVAFQYDLYALDDSIYFKEVHESLATFFQLSPLPRFIPYIEYFQYFGYFKEYSDNALIIRKFCTTLLAHIKRLDEEGKLLNDSLGRALIDFSKQSNITEEHVLSEIIVMFVAGHETTAHALSWVIYSLCKHQDIQDKVHNELINNNPSNKTTEYMEAVIKESMRKYPVAQGNMRQVTQQDGYNLNGIHLRQGDWVVFNSFVIHNLASNWGENVDEFIPERWLNNNDEQEDNLLSSAAAYGGIGQNKDDLSFLPFSYGPRHCIGMHLALLEIRMTITKLLKQFHFGFANEKLLNEAYAMVGGITMRPADGLPVYISLIKEV